MTCEKISSGLTQKLEVPQKGRYEGRKILEEIMAKVFDKNYKPIDQRTCGAHYRELIIFNI